MSKNILLVSSEFPPGPGGIGHHAWFLAKELAKYEDFKITVLCPKDYSSEENVNVFDQAAPFKIHRWERIKGLTYLLRVIKLIRLLLSSEFTHFWSSGKFSLWMIWVQKLFAPNCKSLCILHGSEVNLNNSLLRKFTHNSIFHYHKIISVSKFTQSLLPQHIKTNHTNKTIIPNGLDVSDFDIMSEKISLEGSPILLTVGHVSPRKGQHRLIKALPEIVKKYPGVKYHIVGRPVERKTLELLADKLGVLNHVVFHGTVNKHQDLWKFYNSADVFVLLSENQKNGDVEGFGIVALEANFCGLPVLGSLYCGVEEAVLHQQTGYLVDGNDSDQILAGIVYCIENKDSIDVSAKDWAKCHSWELIGKQFVECL